jgi:inosose dehydratase
MTMKLGIAPINWCNDDDPTLGADISFEQCIREMSQAGYVGTEMGNKYPRNAPLLKQSLAEQGLQMSSAWFSSYFTEPDRYEETMSRFLDHLSFMRALGASYINVCECGHSIQNTSLPILGQAKPQFNQQQWDDLIHGLHAIGRIAYDHHMQLVYHYHAGTGVFTEDEIDYLMRHTSPALVALLLDTGHAAFAGIDPLHLIQKYPERIRYVHLKDIRSEILQDVSTNQHPFMDAVRGGVFTVPGDGDLDFKQLLKALHDIQYKGWLIVEAEQDPAKAPPLVYAKKAHDHLSLIMETL